MTMSNQCKWISFFCMSVTVILLLLLFDSLDNRPRCENEGEYMLNETEECYQGMTRGPCHHNLVFMPDEPKGIYGSCNCPYMFDNRTILFKNGQCYYVFTQAYCPEGHWLTVSQKGEPICETNPCLQHSKNGLEDEANGNDDGDVDMKSNDQYDRNTHDTNGHRKEIEKMDMEWVQIKGGRCVQLGKTTEGCPKGAVVRFHRNYIYPSCFQPPQISLGAISVGPYTSCPLGSYRSIMGKCQPTFDFDFDEAQPDGTSPEARRSLQR